MNFFYTSIGISKQAFHQQLGRTACHQECRESLLPIIHQLRNDHPTMSSRAMYYKLMPEGIGRDAFEAYCSCENLSVKRIKNWRRTTDSSGVTRFENLANNLCLSNIDQLWQSDITYFELNGRFYYLTFVIDAFSRRILGHHTSGRLLTDQTTLPALRMALKERKRENLEGLIFHSDGGGQYYDKEFLKLTRQYKILNSMCEFAWENGKAERINGVIKNNYLKHRRIRNLNELIKEVDRSVKLYNFDKPHIGLQRLTPIKFERQLKETSMQKSKIRNIGKSMQIVN